MSTFPAGTAPIKAEFLLSSSIAPSSIPDDDAAEGGMSRTAGVSRLGEDVRSNGGGRKKMSKEEKKAQRGQNKGRRFGKIRDDLDLCWKIASGSVCEFGPDQCRFNHDIKSYLEAKPSDLRIPRVSEIQDDPPFLPDSAPPSDELSPESICPLFAETGTCNFGYKCRFLRSHVRKTDDGSVELLTDEDKKANTAISAKEVNFVGAEVQKLLRSKKYPFPVSDAFQEEQRAAEEAERKAIEARKALAASEMDVDATETTIEKRTGEASPLAQIDTPDVPGRFSEKKRLHWSGKTYLAPLTTVGNLPFRRLCVTLGADITCGEMGLATSFLQGSKEEWSLVRRHPSERTFGVQVAGNKPNTLVPTAEVIAKEIGSNVDFVDINCGCPIDLVFKSGSGSALLDAPGKLGRIIVGMNKALGDIPVTVKLRTGVKDGKNTLHGRTRQQRYTKLADWDMSNNQEEDLAPIPIFGGGDCFSSEDYWGAIEREAEWDISARERLELIRQYSEFGLSHFGTDTAGVNATRRYLCEALSFQYRYVPIGLLESLPGRINDRAPAFRGRNELESLLASDQSQDWVKISEMFLGPAHEAWSFTPKHKSNAYESQG
ncbi:hypothetical protein CPB85DRAFT_1374476 [Mucidula mucida]|nr:hypothetical protein CPB85DRAFT_1374476 [Mucidula mucida]